MAFGTDDMEASEVFYIIVPTEAVEFASSVFVEFSAEFFCGCGFDSFAAHPAVLVCPVAKECEFEFLVGHFLCLAFVDALED